MAKKDTKGARRIARRVNSTRLPVEAFARFWELAHQERPAPGEAFEALAIAASKANFGSPDKCSCAAMRLMAAARVGDHPALRPWVRPDLIHRALIHAIACEPVVVVDAELAFNPVKLAARAFALAQPEDGGAA